MPNVARALGRKTGRPTHYAAGVHYVALNLTRHLVELPPIPDTVDLTKPWPSLYLGYNDSVSDCGVAGLANGLSTQARREGREAAFAGRSDINEAIRSLYFEYTGGPDEGVVLIDFLHWVRDRPDGFLGEKIGEPIAVDPQDWDQVALALGYGYGLYVGAQMTQASVSQDPGSFFRTDVGDQAIAGGHCMYSAGCIKAGSFDQPNYQLDSWGMPWYATQSWWAHVDEAYILVDLSRPPSGFNLDTLRADIVQVNSARSG